MVNFWIPIIVSIFAITIFALISLGSFVPSQGELSGKVNIGSLCPVEPCPPKPDIYSSMQVVLRPYLGNPIYINLTSNGSFQAKVNAGKYTIDLTNCVYLGCKSTLPQMVTVEPQNTTEIMIEIDTGIR